MKIYKNYLLILSVIIFITTSCVIFQSQKSNIKDSNKSFDSYGAIYDTSFLKKDFILIFSKTDSLYFIRIKQLNRQLDTVFHSHLYPDDDVYYHRDVLFRDYDYAFSIITNGLSDVKIYDKQTVTLLQQGNWVGSIDEEKRFLFLQSVDKDSLFLFDMNTYTQEKYSFYPSTPLGKRWNVGVYISAINDTMLSVSALQIDGSDIMYTIKRSTIK